MRNGERNPGTTLPGNDPPAKTGDTAGKGWAATSAQSGERMEGVQGLAWPSCLGLGPVASPPQSHPGTEAPARREAHARRGSGSHRRSRGSGDSLREVWLPVGWHRPGRRGRWCGSGWGDGHGRSGSPRAGQQAAQARCPELHPGPGNLRPQWTAGKPAAPPAPTLCPSVGLARHPVPCSAPCSPGNATSRVAGLFAKPQASPASPCLSLPTHLHGFQCFLQLLPLGPVGGMAQKFLRG